MKNGYNMTRCGWYTLLLVTSFCQASPFIVYTAPLPDFMISTGPTLAQSRGLAIEILTGACRQAGLDCRPGPVLPWPRAQSEAKIVPNAILTNVTRTPARELLWQWVTPIYTDHVYEITLKNRRFYSSLQAIHQQKVRVGSLSGVGVTSTLQSMGSNPVTSMDTDIGFSRLIGGQIDVFLIQGMTLRSAIDSLQNGPHRAMLAQASAALRTTRLNAPTQLWVVASRSTPPANVKLLSQALIRFLGTNDYRQILNHYESQIPHLGQH